MSGERPGLRAAGRKQSWRGARSPLATRPALGQALSSNAPGCRAAPAAGAAPASAGWRLCGGKTHGMQWLKRSDPLGRGEGFYPVEKFTLWRAGNPQTTNTNQGLWRSIIPRVLLSHRTCGFLPFHTAPLTYLCPG